MLTVGGGRDFIALLLVVVDYHHGDIRPSLYMVTEYLDGVTFEAGTFQNCFVIPWADVLTHCVTTSVYMCLSTACCCVGLPFYIIYRHKLWIIIIIPPLVVPVPKRRRRISPMMTRRLRPMPPPLPLAPPMIMILLHYLLLNRPPSTSILYPTSFTMPLPPIWP